MVEISNGSPFRHPALPSSSAGSIRFQNAGDRNPSGHRSVGRHRRVHPDFTRAVSPRQGGIRGTHHHSQSIFRDVDRFSRCLWGRHPAVRWRCYHGRFRRGRPPKQGRSLRPRNSTGNVSVRCHRNITRHVRPRSSRWNIVRRTPTDTCRWQESPPSPDQGADVGYTLRCQR
jgi:hypothetical protein